MANVRLSGFGFDMDAQHIGDVIGMEIQEATTTTFRASSEDGWIRLVGRNFTYDQNGLNGGTITSLLWYDPGPSGSMEMGLINVPVSLALQWMQTDDTVAAFSYVLGGNDWLVGSNYNDVIRGFGGDDSIQGNYGEDRIFGGSGDDFLRSDDGNGGSNLSLYLRGEEGDDTVIGAGAFDDLHGNQGNDLVRGGGEGDWVVGGKDNDLLYGDDGHDVVWGNLGADTCEGGAGNDQVRGGQGDDIVRGDAGDDWLSGDRGSDTITGGAGRDIFHVFDGAGLDRVSDFSAADGDRVNVLPGNSYSVAQVGADVVVTVQGADGGQMVLVNVQLSSLQYDWIFSG